MNKITLSILLFAGMAACNSGSSEKTTASGYKYQVVVDADGKVPADGEFMILNMKYIDQNDSVWVNTVEMDRPSVIMKQDSVWKASGMPLEEMLADAGKGDSMVITLATDDLFKGGQMPPNVKPGEKFTIQIGVADVLTEEEMQGWQQDMMEKQRVKAEKQMADQLEKDKSIIQKFFEENNIDAQTTESGLSYVITQEGTGEQAKAGDQVRVNYTGHVLGGAYFDTSSKEVAEEKGLPIMPGREYGPFTFTLGQGAVIKGWDEGIALLKEGGKATLYIPSTLAYGPRQRSAEIGPNAILVFEVELVEVVDSNE